jgi:hypothetical protein
LFDYAFIWGFFLRTKKEKGEKQLEMFSVMMLLLMEFVYLFGD